MNFTPAPTLVSVRRPRTSRAWLALVGLAAVATSFAGVWLFLHRAQPIEPAVTKVAAAPSTAIAIAVPPPTSSVAVVAPTTSEHSALHSSPKPAPTVALDPPPPNAPIASGDPPTPSPTKMSGAKVHGAGSSLPQCELRDLPSGWSSVGRTPEVSMSNFARDRIDQCFAAAQFDAPMHETRAYVVFFDRDGAPTNVARNAAEPSVPRLDACIAATLKTVRLGTLRGPCWGEASYRTDLD